MSIKARFFNVLVCLFVCLFVLDAHMALSADDFSSEERFGSGLEKQQYVQEFFSNLELVGNAYNGGGGAEAGSVFVSSACRSATQKMMAAELGILPDLPSNALSSVPFSDRIESFVDSKATAVKSQMLSNLCAALQGQDIQTTDLSQELDDLVKGNILPMAASTLQSRANQTGLPFLGRLEFELGLREHSFISSVTTVQPLWWDDAQQHHIFTQLSWHKAPDDTDNEGYEKYRDTINAGLAYRYLTDDKTRLYGANIFFDHAPKENHNRMSVGVDARTSQASFSANKYIPLSDYKAIDEYYEEKAASGWDLELRGQVPELPSWTASVKGYKWDNQEERDNLYGVETAVEYSPVPALSMRAGVREESQEDMSVEMSMNFKWDFSQPEALQLRPRTALAPVSAYVYEKVSRENLIRVQRRRRASSKLIVAYSTGANTATEARGTTALYEGQTLLMPVTVSVANTAGALARLTTASDGLLTLGQNTTVRVEPSLITLINGSMQYVSDGVITTVAVPGGTIELHGTDIDVVSNGANSTVRVRDGNVTFTGSSSGSANLDPGEMAQSNSGVVGTVASGTATYTTHADDISTKIDRVAPEQEGAKVTPYPIEAPRLVSQTSSTLTLGLKFNSAVTVSGGPPLLDFTINSNSKTANLSSGSGTDDLIFTYTFVPADTGATSLTVNRFDNNGATITGNGKMAVTTIADATITLTAVDATAPAGYSVAFDSVVNDANKAAAAFTISSAEIGSTYEYSISSSGGGTAVTGSGTVASASENVTGIDVTGLGDGTLTVSVTLTDTSDNTGSPVTNTIAKDVVSPVVSSVVNADSDGTYEPT